MSDQGERAKSRNDIFASAISEARGIQILTGNECARANDIRVGAYEVLNDGEDVDEYAKGRRVNLKFYIEDVRFDEQKNEDLTEVTVFMTPEQFNIMCSLEIDADKEREYSFSKVRGDPSD